MSQNAWNEGYFTDVDYVHGYYDSLNPIVQRFYMLAAGYAPLPMNEQTVHCELGFGQGTSISAHAIAQPHAWMGTDFTPSQAAFAHYVTANAGVQAQLLDDSFEQLLSRKDLPQFDSISLHGIWTWISAQNRGYITEFARRHLKPGGTFAVSYNAQPGWSGRTPMRHLLRMRDSFAASFSDLPEGMNTHAQSGKTPNDRRIGQALDLTAAVLARSTKLTLRNPSMPSYFEHVRQHNRTYLAHEYFNSNWDCMFFADVAQELEAAKLNFVCSTDGNTNLATVLDPDTLTKARALLKGISHPVLREQTLDFWRFLSFHRDIFQRGSRKLTAIEQHLQLLENTRFVSVSCLTDAAAELRNSKHKPVRQAEHIWMPILEHLATKQYAPKTLATCLHRIEQNSKVPLSEQIPFITLLVEQHNIAPCQDEAASASVRARCHRFNRWALERYLLDKTTIALVSPLTGGGVPGIEALEKLLLLAWAQGHKTPAMMVKNLPLLLKAAQLSLSDKNGKPITDATQMQRELSSRVEHFLSQRWPVFKALDMLPSA